jgi:hypothetical protein
MSACLKNWTTGFLNLARERMGSDFLSKAEFAAGLDDDPRARLRSAEFGMFVHWDLIGRERGHKRLRRIGVGNPLLHDGLGGRSGRFGTHADCLVAKIFF